MSIERLDSLSDLEDMPEERDLSAPPHDKGAESAVLGSILKNPRSIHQIIDWLVPQAFYEVRHGLIYGAALSLLQQDRPIDYHTLSAEMQRQGGAPLIATKAGTCVELNDLDELQACIDALNTAAKLSQQKQPRPRRAA